MKLSDYEKVESSNIDFKEKVEYSKPIQPMETEQVMIIGIII